MKRIIISLMKDEKSGIVYAAPKLLLFIISFFYGCVIKIWSLAYDKGILKVYNAKTKVVSVGNITLGGTGKTPFSMFLAAYFKERNKKASVLIRGYGDDEWRMLENTLSDIPIITGRDRLRSAEKAVRNHRSEVLILDDGFQHRRLKRDLDIVLIDSSEGFGNSRLFPRGILREPLEAIRRADIIVMTKCDFGKVNLTELRERISRYTENKNPVEAVYKPLMFIELFSKKSLRLDVVRGKNVCTVTAIANPSYFKYILKNLGANLVKNFDFPDHYNYSDSDIKRIQDEVKLFNCDYLAATEKDMVKLDKFRNADLTIPILILYVELEITNGKEELFDRLDSVFSHKAS